MTCYELPSSMVLQTPNTKTAEIGIDIFQVFSRPCRSLQERIYDYHLDGRPQFEWERYQELWVFKEDPRILQICESCHLNVFGGVEGCRGRIENADIFFRALNELTPENPWCKVPRDGVPIAPQELRELVIYLEVLRQKLSECTWPVAIPRQDDRPYRDDPEAEDSPISFYAWNGEGPPGLIFSNDGYTVFLSRHGLLVKPTGEDPVPHAFKRLWKEGRGAFGLSSNGETVGFQMSMARYPTWGFESIPGAELSLETMPADQVFSDVLDVLEVFAGLAQDFETGILINTL